MIISLIIQILPWFYIGSCTSGSDQNMLKKLGVKTIVNVHQHYDPKIDTVEQFHFTLIDGAENDWKTIIHILEIVHEQKKIGNILVHCCAGMSRSPFIAVSYLSEKEGLDVDEALQIVAEKQPYISVHPGLMELLRKNSER
jgi:dual specificity phosphatase 12